MSVNEEQLILQISNFPELYDLQNEHYMNVQRKNNIWAQIGREMGVDGTVLREKWKNLRDSYSRHMKKRKNRSGDGASTSKRWKYERQMEFLRPYIQERATVSNLESPADSGNENVRDDSQGEGMEDTAKSQSSPQPSTSNSKPKSKPSGRKRVEPSQPSVANVLQSFLATRQNNVPQTTTACPIHKFFDAMADSVAALPQDLQLKANGKIFAIVSEVEAENIERNARGIQHVGHDERIQHAEYERLQHAENPLVEPEDSYEEYLEEDNYLQPIEERPTQDNQIKYVLTPEGFLVPEQSYKNYI